MLALVYEYLMKEIAQRFVALDLISGLNVFLGMEEYSHLRKKKSLRFVGSIRIINSEVDLLSGWLADPPPHGLLFPRLFLLFLSGARGEP